MAVFLVGDRLDEAEVVRVGVAFPELALELTFERGGVPKNITKGTVGSPISNRITVLPYTVFPSLLKASSCFFYKHGSLSQVTGYFSPVDMFWGFNGHLTVRRL